MRLPPHAPRCLATFALAIGIVVLPSSIATAGPILLKFDVAVLSPGSPSAFDSSVDVTGAVELNNANGTNVGGLFFDDEFVNVSSDSATTLLAYMIQGGLADHPADGYSTAWELGSAILFANFVLDQPATLASVSVTVDQANNSARVVGAGGGSLVNGVDYFITFQNDLQLQLGGLGILDQPGQIPLGLMTFQLNFVADQPPNPVPDAASSLTLFGMGMAALAARRRFARRRQ
jgi:hypothetical protein